MINQLNASEANIIYDIAQNVRCERALIEAALSDDTKTEIFFNNRQYPSVVVLAYNNEAIILGAPQDTNKLEKFVIGIQRKRGYRRFAHITCPTPEWKNILLSLSNARFRCSERISYTLRSANNCETLRTVRSDRGFTVEKINHSLARLIYEQTSPEFYDFRTAWHSSDEFVQTGLGYCIAMDHEIASIAFSCFPVSRVLEIGTATVQKFRRLGLSIIVSSMLIEDCITRGIEPLWSCYSSNIGSNALAKKLGFEHDHTYYWLYEGRRLLWALLRRIHNLRRIL